MARGVGRGMMDGVAISSVEPSAVWIGANRLRGRMDASYFSASNLKLDEALEFHQNPAQLGEFLKNPKRVLYMKTETFDPESSADGALPFVSGVDLDETT